MAQAPNSSPSKGGGSSKSPGKGSKSSSKKTSRGRGGKGKDPLLSLANVVPAHHAHHGMSGEYATKGKFANWTDGQEAFK